MSEEAFRLTDLRLTVFSNPEQVALAQNVLQTLFDKPPALQQKVTGPNGELSIEKAVHQGDEILVQKQLDRIDVIFGPDTAVLQSDFLPYLRANPDELKELTVGIVERLTEIVRPISRLAVGVGLNRTARDAKSAIADLSFRAGVGLPFGDLDEFAVRMNRRATLDEGAEINRIVAFEVIEAQKFEIRGGRAIILDITELRCTGDFNTVAGSQLNDPQRAFRELVSKALSLIGNPSSEALK